MDGAHRGALAGPARDIRELEYSLPPLSPAGSDSVLEHIFHALSGDPDFEYALIDGTIIRVHQHGTGAKGGLVLRPSGVRAAA
ncbi:hypothetical protein DES45_107148 [Microvirga subterranea]|uniref:Uncharacterized protein n=1 Tax=Microvirga subterranea TaxID=186651 RepID=A0A370HHE0_9HYPH|nr:hypothetical protein DES45_107148 [Microvirga subterranea]